MQSSGGGVIWMAGEGLSAGNKCRTVFRICASAALKISCADFFLNSGIFVPYPAANMELARISRPLLPEEIKRLRKLKKERQSRLQKGFQYYWLLYAVLAGTVFTGLAIYLEDGFLHFLCGTLAVFAWSALVFAPWEAFKLFRRDKAQIAVLDECLNSGTIRVVPVNALRIALAPEFEDESDLYMVEYAPDHILYIWDIDYNLEGVFPCMRFDLYEPEFAVLTGMVLHPRSEKIEPVHIDKAAKWKHLGEFGGPGEWQAERRNFDELIAAFGR